MESDPIRKHGVPAVFNPKKPWLWIILVAILCCIAVAVCFLTLQKNAKAAELSREIERISGTMPENTFLYLYRNETSSFCYSLNGETGCGTVDAYYDEPFDLFAEIRQGKIAVDHDPAHMNEILGSIHDTSVSFLQNAAAGSKRYNPGLFEQVLPLYTQDVRKCREITLKQNDAGFPVSKESTAYFTIDESGCELIYYGQESEKNICCLLLYIGVSDLEAVINRFAPKESPVPSAAVTKWLDYHDASGEVPREETKELALDAFPGVTFRWTSGSVEAVEDGKTRTLFFGMPIWNVYLADVTGDSKPELCAAVSFGSGIVDEHIVVYDYANLQSYTLWDRMRFDYHLYVADGELLVGRTPYMGDKQVDAGTLVMRDGILSCRWQSDGSYLPLDRQLNGSELIGEWLVQEETDNDGNVLYTFALDNLWKEYHFREDGTVVYNETIPISSDSEKAFGHPAEYPYSVHDNLVYIAEDDADFFRFGTYNPETDTIQLMYNTSERTVYATLRRMGADAEP